MQRNLIHGLLVLALVTLGICYIQREMRKSIEARQGAHVRASCGSSICDESRMPNSKWEETCKKSVENVGIIQISKYTVNT